MIVLASAKKTSAMSSTVRKLPDWNRFLTSDAAMVSFVVTSSPTDR